MQYYTVLLTRAEAQNQEIASQITRCFRDSHCSIRTVSRPLLEALAIAPNQAAKSTVLDLDLFDKIVFISKNAVKYGMPLLSDYWPAWPLKLKWLAVGPATAKSLSTWDLKAPWPENASSEGLLTSPELQAGKVEGQKILIVRGVGGRETLRLELEQRGAAVTYLEAYERVPVAYDSGFVQGIPAACIGLLYSGEAILHLDKLASADKFLNKQNMQLVVPSQRLVEMARTLGFGSVIAADNQTDDAMLDTLASLIEDAA